MATEIFDGHGQLLGWWLGPLPDFEYDRPFELSTCPLSNITTLHEIPDKAHYSVGLFWWRRMLILQGRYPTGRKILDRGYLVALKPLDDAFWDDRSLVFPFAGEDGRGRFE